MFYLCSIVSIDLVGVIMFQILVGCKLAGFLAVLPLPLKPYLGATQKNKNKSPGSIPFPIVFWLDLARFPQSIALEGCSTFLNSDTSYVFFTSPTSKSFDDFLVLHELQQQHQDVEGTILLSSA